MTLKPTDLPAQPLFDESIPVPVPASVFVDRDGEVWRAAGRSAGGDVLLVCDEPQAPGDRGDGVSFPWTFESVTAWFGPLGAVAR